MAEKKIETLRVLIQEIMEEQKKIRKGLRKTFYYDNSL